MTSVNGVWSTHYIWIDSLPLNVGSVGSNRFFALHYVIKIRRRLARVRRRQYANFMFTITLLTLRIISDTATLIYEQAIGTRRLAQKVLVVKVDLLLLTFNVSHKTHLLKLNIKLLE